MENKVKNQEKMENTETNVNLKLWEQVEITDPQHTKRVTYGTRSFTTISAQYQIQQATGIWGPYGSTWGIKSLELEFINLTLDQKMVLGRAVFYYPNEDKEIAFPISSTIMMQEYNDRYKKLMVEDEFAKKLETDITTKALSKLGFAADVFLGRYDDNKYINDLRVKFADKQPPTPPTPDPKKQEVTASAKAINGMVNLIKEGEFDRVQKNLLYWEETSVKVNDKDLERINQLMELLKTD